jgi:hypothetical protein
LVHLALSSGTFIEATLFNSLLLLVVEELELMKLLLRGGIVFANKLINLVVLLVQLPLQFLLPGLELILDLLL